MADVVIDTFTGTGTWDAHVGETSATWDVTELFGASAMVLTGGSVVANARESYSSGELTAVAPPSGIVTYECDITKVRQDLTGSGRVGVWAGDTVLNSSFELTNGYFGWLLTSSAGVSRLGIQTWIGGVLTLNDEYNFEGTELADGAYTLQVVVNAARTQYTLKVNGTTYLTATTDAVPVPTKHGAFFSGRRTLSPTVYSETFDGFRLSSGAASTTLQGAGRRRVLREVFVAEWRGEEYHFHSMEALEDFVATVRRKKTN